MELPQFLAVTGVLLLLGGVRGSQALKTSASFSCLVRQARQMRHRYSRPLSKILFLGLSREIAS